MQNGNSKISKSNVENGEQRKNTKKWTSGETKKYAYKKITALDAKIQTNQQHIRMTQIMSAWKIIVETKKQTHATIEYAQKPERGEKENGNHITKKKTIKTIQEYCDTWIMNTGSKLKKGRYVNIKNMNITYKTHEEPY